MHKAQGIQLGLTDSIRCKLPEGYDGTGYWEITVYALVYKDSVFRIQAAEDNIVKAEEEACSHLDAAIKNLTRHNSKTTLTAASTSADGTSVTKCVNCGTVSKQSVIPKITSVSISKSSYTYNKKVQKPNVTVKDRTGAVISSANYSLKYSAGSKNPGRYAVTVTFKGNYKGSVTKYYTISPAKTTLKLSKAKKTSLKASWKKAASVSGYQIQYGTSSKFKKAKTVTVSYKTSSKILKKLKKNKKYYSKWSSAKKLKTKR